MVALPRAVASRNAEILFRAAALAAISAGVGVIVLLLATVAYAGCSRIDWQFLTSFPSRHAEKAGIVAALVGTLYLMMIVLAVAVPVGVGAAIYLEMYSAKNRFARFVELCIANLAGVPSVIYGLLGLQLFVRVLAFDRSLLAGGLTLALLVLPVIIIASREALRAVPRGYVDGAVALGATKWQAVRTQVLPAALPGITTGCILALSRAIGETAPLVTLGALTYVGFYPESLFSPFSAMPIQIFNWLSKPQQNFHINAAGAIVVLMAMVLSLNAVAFVIRAKSQARQK
jgi:phosphate transport system permease protein